MMNDNGLTRRKFISAGASAAVLGAVGRSLYAAGSDKIRIGLIGCGRRGSGAVADCLRAAGGVEFTAMGDVFAGAITSAGSRIMAVMSKYQIARERFNVSKENIFTGFDAYERVLESDVDLVILGTPPQFRPFHFKAAVEAGKHVFMEKPVAVDPVGVRSVIESAKLAEQKGVAVVAGTQRRHQKHYLEIFKRIHNGDIGEIVSAQCYWNQDGVLFSETRPEWSEMERQLRNWYYFTWLSGDIIVEQHVHNIDVVNWAFGEHPVKAMGMGGRQVRNEPKYGNIYDHFAVEYEYPSGTRALSMCRQMDGCSQRISEHIVGTKGTAYTDEAVGRIEGPYSYEYRGPNPDPYVEEHKDLIASIRKGSVLNEGKRVAESTMTGIMGRMSAYTGRELKWDWVMKSSKLDLSPPSYEFGDLPVRDVAVPGKTPLV